MAAPVTSTEFLELVRKSGVLDEKRLDAYLAKARAVCPLPDEPGKLGGLLVRDGLLTHFQAEQILQGKWRRFTIGKYKVLERLGAGGMGTVYLCEHTLMRRRVAVKVLPTAKAADESTLQRFYREARAAAALDHPNIVHAYDIDQDESLHFLVMEYVDGSSLQEVIKKSGPMEPARAAYYVRQTALGLEHAHHAGLVHRDIKPGNLLLDRAGILKILDMGLARFFNDEDDILTRKFEESVLGTADYLAPEQAVDSHAVDIRADIYSLGATFYFLLTGKTPFEGGTVAQKLIWHQTRQAKPISAFRSDVPPGLQAILDKMMAKDRDKRYQTPAELADALAPWTPGSVAPPPEAEMPRLSPAAAGPTQPAEATLVTSSGTGPVSPTPRKPWQVSAPPSSNSPVVVPKQAPPSAVPLIPAPAPRPAPAVVRPQPAVPAVPVVQAVAEPPAAEVFAPHALELDKGRREAPAPTAAPAPEEEAAPWESATPETADFLSQVDTGAASGRRSGPALGGAGRARATQQESRRLRWVLLGVGAAFVVGLVVVLIEYLVKKPPPEAPPAERPPLLVTRAAGHAGAFPSVQQALSRAERGDVIQILDEQIEENLVVERHNVKPDVTVEAYHPPGKSVHWIAAKGKEAEPLLHVSGATGFHLKGEGITLDGQDRAARLVLLDGTCEGVTLEGLRLQGFTQMAIQVISCTGSQARPVRLLDLQTLSVPKEPPAAAVYFEIRPDMFIQMDEHIHVGGNCVFPGLARPFQRKDAKAVGPSVQLPNGYNW